MGEYLDAVERELDAATLDAVEAIHREDRSPNWSD
jgi:hypothetical protein